MKVTKQALKRGIVKVVSSGKVGTGFIVSGEGHILTCMHNLVGMDIGIMLPDAEGHFSTPVLPALPVTFRPSNKEDFAVLKVDDLPSHTHSLPLMGAGESVEHEGYSHGFPQVGDINGIGAQYKIIDPHQRSSFGYPMIQLGVANDITEGFSGAPILDLSLGKVVGMIRQIPFTDEDNRLQNAAFGIPLDFIAKVCEEKYKLVVERPGAVDWPIGVKPIKDSAPTRTTRKIRFDDYLYSNRLPYYSRDTFAAAQEGEDIGHALRESELLDRLLGTEEEASKLSGAIISGEGGVGKTRLMLELGRMASQREWEVLVVDSNLENLEVVKPYLKPKTKYLFIFDYLEEHSAFDAALEDTLAEPEREIEVKLLANCRITFKNKSEAYPEDRWIEEVKLDEQAPSELNYKSYVVQSILQSYIGEVPKRVLDLAKLRPAFAVPAPGRSGTHRFLSAGCSRQTTLERWPARHKTA